MSGITIQLPSFSPQDSIEIEVRVNGKRQIYKYRVEIVNWDECEEGAEPEVRVQCLKRVIDDYDAGWQLVNIGLPTEKSVPVMFRKREADLLDPSSGVEKE